MPQLTPEVIAYQTAHIHDDKRPGVIAGIAVLTSLATLAVVMRIWVRLNTRAGFQADDHTIFAALILAWGSFVGVYLETRYGLGKHLIAMSGSDFMAFCKVLLFTGPAFVLAVMFNQLSVVLLYRRVFTTQLVWFRRTLYILGGISVANGFAFVFPFIFECTPFNYSWNGNIPGHCINVNAMTIANDVIIFVINVAIVVTPMTIIWRLQMDKSTKMAVSVMFLLGGFVCVISLIRLPWLIHIPVEDLTWTNVPPAVWTHAELCVGIISACLPCYRPFFRGILILGSKRSKGSDDSHEPYFKELPRNVKGNASWFHGSNVRLVPAAHRSSHAHAHHDPNMTLSSTTTATARTNSAGDVETGLSPHAIEVKRDVIVSRSEKN